MAPVWVAQEANLFAKHGVDVDLKYSAATTAVQAMVAGNEEIGLVGNQGVDAKLEGADLIYVASSVADICFPSLCPARNQNAGRSQGQSCGCDPTRGIH
jgi:hypothetical protein